MWAQAVSCHTMYFILSQLRDFESPSSKDVLNQSEKDISSAEKWLHQVPTPLNPFRKYCPHPELGRRKASVNIGRQSTKAKCHKVCKLGNRIMSMLNVLGLITVCAYIKEWMASLLRNTCWRVRGKGATCMQNPQWFSKKRRRVTRLFLQRRERDEANIAHV